VLLIQQQGPDDPVPSWYIPSGRVEQSEILLDALHREVSEETGLHIGPPARLVYVVHSENEDTPKPTAGDILAPSDSATAYVFEVVSYTGDLNPRDPDGFVFGISFFDRHDAVERLERLPWRVMREPLVAALRGDAVAGSVWMYRREAAGDALVGRVPSPAGEAAPTPTVPLNPRQQRQRDALILGCMAIVVLFVVIVIIGLIAAGHSHL
jgi:8-oxo-dGTP pyrophosphatase MutT (NUDIX family)